MLLQAGQLAKLLRSVDMHCHVNLIPWNPVPGLNFERPSNNCAHRFQRELQVRAGRASQMLVCLCRLQQRACMAHPDLVSAENS